jgi:hypothetical protein
VLPEPKVEFSEPNAKTTAIIATTMVTRAGNQGLDFWLAEKSVAS